MQRAPCPVVRRWHPWGRWPGTGKRCSLRQCAAVASCRRAGLILWCAAESGSCRVPSPCKPGWPSSAFALRDGRWVCVGLRKLYWPCWLVQRSAGGYPGSPPVAGELIYHLPLQVHVTVSDTNCQSSVPCPSLVTYPGLSRATCLIPGRAEPACYGHSMETSLVLYSTPWAGPS